MSRFDQSDAKYTKRIRAVKMPIEVNPDAEYTEYWIMKKMSRGRRTQWSGWRSQPTLKHLRVFYEREYPFQIIENSVTDEEPRVVFSWCPHVTEEGKKDGICSICLLMLAGEREKHPGMHWQGSG